MADGVIGSVSVAVVPDARAFWDKFKASTASGEKGAEPSVKVNADTEEAEAKLDELKARISATSGTVKVKVDSSDASKATSEMHLLRDSILLLGPTLVPVAGVATGVLAGLLPVAASLVLGVKGITAEFKSGSLAGTQYASDLTAVKSEYSTLQTIAAHGLLPGLDQALTTAKPQFAALNSDLALTSVQLGDIAAHVGPGILSLLHQLSPLFAQVGQEVADGAIKFEQWASSGGGIQKFVAYAEANLPAVESDLGSLLTAVGHLTSGLSGFGLTGLRTLSLVSNAISAIPIGVLSKLETTVLAGYAAWRTYSAVTGVITTVNSAINKLTATSDASAAAQIANQARLDAAYAQRSESIVASNLAALQSEAALAAEVAEQAILMGTANATAAAAIATASAEEVASYEAVAAAAADSVATTVAAAVAAAAAAETAASAEAAAGETAAAGWAAILGPVAAVAVGVGLLASVFLGSSNNAQKAAEAANTYNDSLKKSTDLLSQVNISQTLDNLNKAHALTTLGALTKSTSGLTLNTNDLVLAINGSDKQYQSVINTLNGVVTAGTKTFTSGKNVSQGYTDQAKGARSLISTLETYRKGLTDQQKAQIAYNAALKAAQIQLDGGTTATKNQAAALGATSDAYVAAQQTAATNTAQTKAQTIAFQLENDAASLLSTALQGLAGDNLGVAQAQTSLSQANLGVASSFKQNGVAIAGASAKAVANQEAIQANVTAAQQLAEAIGKQTGSSRDAIKSFEDSKTALEAQLKAQGELTPAVQAYINQLYNLKNLKVPPTKLDVDNAAAAAKIKSFQTEINSIRQGKDPKLGVDTTAARDQIALLQSKINSLEGKTVFVGAASVHADGGPVFGSGTGTSDSINARLSNGEYVINAKQTAKHRALLDAINKGASGFAAGGAVGSNTTYTGAGGVQYASQLSAINSFTRAATSLDKATAALLKDAEASATTTAQFKTDADAVIAAAKKDGDSVSLLKELAGYEKNLLADSSKRTAVLNKLGSAPSPATAYDKLSSDIQTYTNELQTVSQAVTSIFDIKSAGTTLTPLQQQLGQSPTVGAQTLMQLTGDVVGASQFKTELAELEKLLVNPKSSKKDQAAGEALYQQLAEGGPLGSGAEVAGLLADKGDIAQIVKEFAKLEGLGVSTGNDVAKVIDGAAVVTDKAVVAQLIALDKSLTKSIGGIGGQFADALDGKARKSKSRTAGTPTGKKT